MNTDKSHILVLPRWYPNENDIQLGTFIREQAILMSNKYMVSVIYVYHSSNQKEAYQINVNQSNGINEILISFKTYRFLKKVRHYLSYRKAQTLGLKHLTQPVNLCHVHVPIRPGFLAQILKRKKAVPFLITEHWSGHLNGLYSRKNLFYKYYYRKVLKKASAITTVSHHLQEFFLKNTGLSSTVIPNYIQFKPTNNTNTDHTSVEILSISDFIDSTKNISGLIHAFKQVLSVNAQAKLTLVGDGPDFDSILSLIDDLGLKESITLTGRLSHDKVLALIPSFDFYVCNSNFESFGMTVAEALAAGKPVVCTKCGGPESFVNAENGILTDVDAPNQLKEALIEMIASFRDYDSKAISDEIRAKFGKNSILKKWSDLYDSILHG